MIMLYVEPGDDMRYRVVVEPLDAYSAYVRANGMDESPSSKAKIAARKPTAFSFSEGDTAWTGNCFMDEPSFDYAAEKLDLDLDPHDSRSARRRPTTCMMAYLCLRAVLDVPLMESSIRAQMADLRLDEWFQRLTPGWDEKLRHTVRAARERAYLGYADAAEAADVAGA